MLGNIGDPLLRRQTVVEHKLKPTGKSHIGVTAVYNDCMHASLRARRMGIMESIIPIENTNTDFLA